MPQLNQTTLLAILQQSEYDLTSFQRWYDDHHLQQTKTIEPEKWTWKLKLVKKLVNLLAFLPVMARYKIAVLLLWPIEKTIRLAYYASAMIKLFLFRLGGLKVVAIAGSYGKTSTKNILSHLLGDQISILTTPKSINTPLGIAQVIHNSLTSKHKLFVVEMGEYQLNDIAELTKFVNPDFAILTPIGRQHLEKFGHVEAIANTFQPLLNKFSSHPHQLLISAQNNNFFANSPHPTYADQQVATLSLENVSVSRRGTEFEVVTKHQTYPTFMPLFGAHQATNTLPSFWLAKQLNLSTSQLTKRASSLPYIDRRHQPHFSENNVLILDNSYNTNPDSVVASLKLLNDLPASRRIIITAGFAELGAQTQKIHYQFGRQLAASVDYLGLIETPWTDSIVEGFTAKGGKRSHISIAKDFDQVLAKVSGMITPNSIVLFEGGYREIYV